MLSGLPLLLVCALLAGGRQEPAPLPAALESVFAAPALWLDREARVTFQLADLPEQWNPGLTRFGTQDYLAAEVWGDAQLLWREQEFLHPLGLLFARRGSDAARQLAGASPYQRFTARIHVRQVFLGRPWAEVLELFPEPGAVGEGTILHAARALHLMAAEDWQLAREDLLRAGAPLLPPHAQAELDRLRAVCDEELARRASRRVPARRSR